MRILVTESEPGAGTVPGTLLALNGYGVDFCHQGRTDPDAPCAALVPGGACPLETRHVDLVVDVRPGGGPFTPREAGVMCALFMNKPLLVVGGPPEELPDPEEDGIAVCEPGELTAAASALLTPTGPAAHRAMREALEPLLRPEGLPSELRLTERDGTVHIHITLVREIVAARLEAIRRAAWLTCARLTRGRADAAVHITIRDPVSVN